MSFQFNEVESDIIDNPGEIDHRLLKDKVAIFFRTNNTDTSH